MPLWISQYRSLQFGKLESIQTKNHLCNISRYRLSRYFQGKSVEKMSLYGRQAQGLEKNTPSFPIY